MIIKIVLISLIYLIEPYVWLEVMSTLGWKNRRWKKCKWLIFLGYYVLTWIKQFVVFWGASYDWRNYAGALFYCYIIFMLMAFDDNIIKRIYNLAIFIMCSFLVELLVYLVAVFGLHVATNSFFKLGMENIICTAICKIIVAMMLSFFISKKYRTNLIEPLYNNEELVPLIIMTIVFEFATFCALPYVEFEYTNSVAMTIIILGQVILCITLIYAYCYLRKIRNDQRWKAQEWDASNSKNDLEVGIFVKLGIIKSLVKKKKLRDLNSYCWDNGKILKEVVHKNRKPISLFAFTCLFELVALCAFPYISCCVKKRIAIMLVIASQILLFVSLFYIIHYLIKVKCELAQKEKIIDLTNRLDDLRHDMAFHIKIMKSLIQNKKYEDLESYFSETFSYVEVAEETFALNNYLVSIVLSDAMQEIKKRNIKFTRFIAVEDFKMSDHEICTLISNILKNAIEAAEQVKNEKGFICLEIAPNKTGYYINCINSYAKKPQMVNGSFITSKSDAMNHGRGMNIIRKIVEKNGGEVTTSIEESYFEINCTIVGAR